MTTSTRARSYILLNLALVPSVSVFALAAYHISLNGPQNASNNKYEHGIWLFSLLIIFLEVLWLNCYGLLQRRTPTKTSVQSGLAPNVVFIIATFAMFATARETSPIAPRMLASAFLYSSISVSWASLFRTSKSQLAAALLTLVLQFTVDIFFAFLFWATRMEP